MTLDGLFAQDQRVGDFPVALRQCDEAEDLYLAPGQTAKGAPGHRQATGCVSNRRRLVSSKCVLHDLVQSHRASMLARDSRAVLAQTACRDFQPALESISVRWERYGPERVAQAARGFSQSDCAPGLCDGQRARETFDAMHRRQLVAGLPSETQAVGKGGACLSGVALRERVLRQEYSDQTTPRLMPSLRPRSTLSCSRLRAVE